MKTNGHCPIAAENGATPEQVMRASQRYVARCLKHPTLLPKNALQEVLEHEGSVLADRMYQETLRRAKRRSQMVVRHFKVDWSKTPSQMLSKLKCGKMIQVDELAAMTTPSSSAKEGDLFLFPYEGILRPWDLKYELEDCGLDPHPYGQLQVNIDDVGFMDRHPNVIVWPLANSAWEHWDTCKKFGFAHLHPRYSGSRVDRQVIVGSCDHDYYWGRDHFSGPSSKLWFGGVPKPR